MFCSKNKVAPLLSFHFRLVKTWWNDVLFKGEIEVHFGQSWAHRGYRQSFLKNLFKIKIKIAAKINRARSQSISGKGKFNNLLLGGEGGGEGGERRKGRGVTCPWLRDCSSFFFFDRKLTFLNMVYWNKKVSNSNFLYLELWQMLHNTITTIVLYLVIKIWLMVYCNLPFIKCSLRKIFCWPFNSQKWLTCTFSLKYPYIIQQAGNENIQTYQVEVVISILLQILITNLQGNM